MTLNAERARELLCYDPETGVMTWRVNRYRVMAGEPVRPKDSRGYTYVKIDQKRYMLHRVAWLYMTGEWPNGEIDHINRVKDDNRFINLRVVTRGQNIVNRGIQRNNTTGSKGVVRRPNGKFRVEVGKENKHLGYFDTKEEAKMAYDTEMRARYGEFYLAQLD